MGKRCSTSGGIYTAARRIGRLMRTVSQTLALFLSNRQGYRDNYRYCVLLFGMYILTLLLQESEE